MENVELRDCAGITDLTPLEGVKTLKEVTIKGGTSIWKKAIDTLQAARPDLTINTLDRK